MNIFDKLTDEKQDKFIFESFGFTDFSVIYEIGFLTKKCDLIVNYFNDDYDLSKQNGNDFFMDYFFLLKYNWSNDDINKINENNGYREKCRKVVDSIRKVLSKINKNIFSQKINNFGINHIFSLKNYSLNSCVLWHMFESHKDIDSKQMYCLMDKMYFDIVSNFDKLSTVFKKHLDWCKYVFKYKKTIRFYNIWSYLKFYRAI